MTYLLDEKLVNDIREQLKVFALLVEGYAEAKLVAPHGMTSAGPRRVLESLDAVSVLTKDQTFAFLRVIEDMLDAAHEEAGMAWKAEDYDRILNAQYDKIVEHMQEVMNGEATVEGDIPRS